MIKRYFLISGLIVLCTAFSANIKAQAKPDDKESARVFVQKFYDWYSVLFDAEPVQKPGKLSSQQIAMKHSREFFSAHLRTALSDYYNRPLKDDEDIGLDFDPFIAGQDLGAGLQTCNVRQEGNRFWVDVHNIKKGQPQKAIQAAEVLAVAEVTKEDGHWVIINFEYPPAGDKANLLAMLEDQKKTETGKK
ncbi:MAG TPA: hypothetical protein VFE53_04200 [Mucilaginibacter sp.]|nr:hypothetical protein [Mucilaginibacter sp.]